MMAVASLGDTSASNSLSYTRVPVASLRTVFSLISGSLGRVIGVYILGLVLLLFLRCAVASCGIHTAIMIAVSRTFRRGVN